ncbi:MAG: DUF2442 domain-containing protein [Planctomycetales bacterium]
MDLCIMVSGERPSVSWPVWPVWWIRGVMIELNNDCHVCIPLRLLPELYGASQSDLRQVEVMGFGQTIEWPTLDQQFDVLQLVADAVGALPLLPARGQQAGSVPPRAAGRDNGMKRSRSRKRCPSSA